MKNRLPQIKSNKIKICIVCEGFEEAEYIGKLKSIGVWHQDYEITIINAKTATNIAGVYKLEINRDIYRAVLIFCDTDSPPYKGYLAIKNNIDTEYDIEGLADKVIIFANPCTMQVILLHIEDVRLSKPRKGANRELIERLTGIKDYDAHEEQRKKLFKNVKHRNYSDMKDRAGKLSTDELEISSTNIVYYLENLEANDDSWTKQIMDSV